MWNLDERGERHFPYASRRRGKKKKVTRKKGKFPFSGGEKGGRGTLLRERVGGLKKHEEGGIHVLAAKGGGRKLGWARPVSR